MLISIAGKYFHFVSFPNHYFDHFLKWFCFDGNDTYCMYLYIEGSWSGKELPDIHDLFCVQGVQYLFTLIILYRGLVRMYISYDQVAIFLVIVIS